ncbi:MAG: autotransporter outer membrane beta-barrel domain-containing protein [Pseudomonadota bacterium]|nr:autotransporter outer membrane beta-barrel domain-containing protein [Pseudomonadota bacterium]
MLPPSAIALPPGGPKTARHECQTLGTLNLSRYIGTTVQVSAGDTLNFASGAPIATTASASVQPNLHMSRYNTVQVSFNKNPFQVLSVPGSITAPADGIFYVSTSLVFKRLTSTAMVEPPREVLMTCAASGGTAPLVDVQGQAQSVQRALFKNAQSRRGNGANTVTQNSLFVATRNLTNGASYQDTPEFNAWVSLEARRLDGDTDGHVADLTFGFDQEVGESTLIGGFLGYGSQKLTTGAITSEAKSPAIGAYASFTLGANLYLDAHLGFAKPSYEIGAGSFKADRYFGGLSLNGRIDRENVEYVPFLTLQSIREKRPSYSSGGGTIAANTIESHVGTLGVRLDAKRAWSGGLKPYASIGVDFAKSSDTAGAEDDFVAARLGLGGTIETGSGLLRFDFDAGKVGSNTRDYGAQISYEFNF